jgi:DNA-directed RNA polymerase subunit RPC12/RpoP
MRQTIYRWRCLYCAKTYEEPEQGWSDELGYYNACPQCRADLFVVGIKRKIKGRQ